MIVRSKKSPAQTRRGGYALVIVLGVTLTATVLAAVQLRYLHSALQIERARAEADDHSEGPLTVLAIAITRLESGNPPETSYQFDHTIDGGSTRYLVSYTRTGNQWFVFANPQPSLTGLPTLPDSF